MAGAGESRPIPIDLSDSVRPESGRLRRPLVGVALLFLAGTLAGLKTPAPFAVPLALSVAALSGAVVAGRPGWRASGLGVHAAVFCAGWAGAAFSIHPPGGVPVENVLERPREAVRVTGTIASDPVFVPFRESPGDGSAVEAGQWVFTLDLRQVRRLEADQRIRGRVRCRWRRARGDAPGFAYGQTWRVRGVLQDESALYPDQARRFRYALVVRSSDATLLSRAGGNPLMRWCYAGRRASADILERGLADRPETRGLLKALMLGYRSDLSEDMRTAFEVTGTLHIFAISGLHVGVFAVLVTGLLRMVGIPRQRWSLVLIPVLAMYVIGTGMKPSAVRAGVMAAMFWSGPTFWRKPDAPSALAMAALLIVGCRPRELVSPGFILSFAVVIGILCLMPMLDAWVRERVAPDPWRADRAEARVRLRWRVARAVASLAMLSIACWLVSFPLTAYFFSLASPIGLLGNIVVVPGAFLVVLTGCLSLVCGTISPFVSEVFNHANAVFIGCLLAIVDGLSMVPMGHRHVPPPGMAWVAGWYLLVAFLVWGPSRRTVRTAVGGGLVILAAAAYFPGPVGGVSMRVLAADGAVMLQVADGGSLVQVEAGPAYRAERMVEDLHRRGINRLETLILPRTSIPAVNGAIALLERMPAGMVWIPAPAAEESGGRDALTEWLGARNLPLRRLRSGDAGFFSGGTEWEVLDAGSGGAGGAVLRVARDRLSVIHMTEPDRLGQYALTEAAIEPAAEVLIASDARHPPELWPGWLEDAGVGRVVAARRSRRWARDDYRGWERRLARLGLEGVLLEDGESAGLDPPIRDAMPPAR